MTDTEIKEMFEGWKQLQKTMMETERDYQCRGIGYWMTVFNGLRDMYDRPDDNGDKLSAADLVRDANYTVSTMVKHYDRMIECVDEYTLEDLVPGREKEYKDPFESLRVDTVDMAADGETSFTYFVEFAKWQATQKYGQNVVAIHHKLYEAMFPETEDGDAE